MLLRTLTFILTILMLSLTSCRKCDDPCNKECDNYDPCCNAGQTNASFKIYENLMWPGSDYTSLKIENTQFASDTIVGNNAVTFRADYDAEYYQWKVGSDPREWNTKEFNLSFGTISFYTPITVTLKVFNPSDKLCNPEAQDTATFTRTLVTVPRDSSLIFGKFEGYILAKPYETSFFEFIKGFDDNDPFTFRPDTLRTILLDCELVLGSSYPRLGYRNYYYWTPHTDNCCYSMTSYGELSGENIIIKYVHFDHKDSPERPCFYDINTEIHGVFKGKRVF